MFLNVIGCVALAIFTALPNNEEWQPSFQIVEDVYLIPTVEVYPVGTVALEFSLINNSDETFRFDSRTMLIKNINEQWYVVPFKGNVWNVTFPETLYTLKENTRHPDTILFDIEAWHGSLPVGEYALVKTLGGLGVRYYVLGHFTICDYSYEIGVAATNIAPRPLGHKLDVLIYDYPNLENMLVSHSAQGFVIWRLLSDYEYETLDRNILFEPWARR